MSKEEEQIARKILEAGKTLVAATARAMHLWAVAANSPDHIAAEKERQAALDAFVELEQELDEREP